MSKCDTCMHRWQFATDDVAFCNCCDDGEFYYPMSEEDAKEYFDWVREQEGE